MSIRLRRTGMTIREILENYSIFLSLAVAAIIFLVMWYKLGLAFLAIALAAMILSVVFERLSRYLEHRNREDERLVKIAAFASANSLVATLFVMLGVDVLSILDVLPNFSTRDILGLEAYILFLVLVIWCAIYSFKGDVE